MELRLLRYFLAVAREENITRAAQSLHMAQPSLSKQMMDLERELGKPLFVRGKRKIILTEEGVHLRKRAEEILLLCEKTEREISQDSTLVAGEISIGGAQSAAVIRAASAVLAQYPNVRFQFVNGDAQTLSERLDHGSLDFGVFIEPEDLVKYEHIPLPDYDEWGVLLHCEHPFAQKIVLSPEDVKNLSLMIPHRAALQRVLSTWAGAETEQMRVVASYDILFNNPLLFVQSGTACAFASRTFAATGKQAELCFVPLEPPIKIQYGLVWKRYPAFSSAAEKFLEMIRKP